jgi:uncharacterized membrane-anchored protein
LVKDDYERNRSIIDLHAQPEHIKIILDETISAAVQQQKKPAVGPHFMKFCGRHNMQKAVDSAQQHTEWLGATYA